MAQQLHDRGIFHADAHAETLVIMGIYDDVEPLLDLLRSERIDLLQMAYKLSGLQRSAQTIGIATDRASKVVFALKTYAHPSQSSNRVALDLIASLDTALTLYQNQFKRGVDVIRLYEPIPSIEGYPDELNQVWANLLQNALQAMDYRGTLTLRVWQQGEQVRVHVTDTGVGIPAEIQAKIFDPFFTTKAAGEGSGLGLNIVKKIVEKHHGQITLTSSSGCTTFELSLPIGGNTVLGQGGHG